MTKKRRSSPAMHARDLLDTLDIRKVPVPLEMIGEHLGAKIRIAPLDEELSGIIFIRDGMPIIGINAIHHPNRQRFTLAHEFGHLVLHKHLITSMVHVDKKLPFFMRDAKSATGTDKIEIEANQFAAELLMPEAILLKEIQREAFDIDDEPPLEELARKFRVSKQAMGHRIQNIF
jgi:Zn-dependent peptidase ImmA (M78 family)